MFKIIFSLFIYALYKVVAVEHETIFSPTGVAFMKEDNVIVTGDSWTIVILINASQHFTNAQILQENLIEVEEQMRELNLYDDAVKVELSRLQDIINSLVKVNEALTEMLGTGNTRPKRFLFNFIGTVVRGLFGAASNSEMERLTTRVRELEYRVRQQEAFEKYQMSITKVLNQKVEQNAKNIIQLTNLVKKEVSRLDQYSKYLGNKIDQLRLQTEAKFNITAYFRLMESEALHSLILANRFHSGLEMAAEGKISFSLISAKDLREELIRIPSLPFGMKLVSDLRIDDMYKYRDIGEVTAIANNDLLLLSLKLPLYAIDRGFKLYKVHSVPIKDKSTGQILRMRPDSDYFVVSDDHRYYGLMSYADVQLCRGTSPKVCPATMVLTTKYVPSCLSAIYYQMNDLVEENSLSSDNIKELCKASVIVKEYGPIWIQDKKNEGWIYSVAKPTLATLHCSETFNKDIELSGTNILANVSHCSISGRDFKLFRTHEGKSYSNGSYTITTPSKMPILKDVIIEKLANSKLVEKAVEDLRSKGFVQEGLGYSEEVSVDMLLAEMERSYEPLYSGENNVSSWYLVILPAFVSLILSAAVCYIILFYDKNHDITKRFSLIGKFKRNQKKDADKEDDINQTTFLK
ncbi:hypothetical protein O3M35_007735 [Rhynocoris fuscipes]|uniref:Uncharacterized protein n=1 Tax=Rhynocoris fuscipes TaxID=488301 RepID=A0AAW1DAC9_9HEMI